MALNESTPVTVHQHTGGTSTFTNYPYDVTLSADQAADEILGTAVLSNGAEVVVTATVGLISGAPIGDFYPYVSSYTSVQVTTIDNGTATTNTLSFAAGADFLNRQYSSEDLQVVGLSNGGYVIAETTVDDNVGPVNKNLYFEVLSNSGSVVTSWTQVNQTGSDASGNDDYQLRATANGGFVIQFATNDSANGFFQRFNASGATTDSPVNFDNASSNTSLSGGFAVDTAGDVAVTIPNPSGFDYQPSSIAIYSSTDARLISETWATAESGLVPEQSVSIIGGGTGIPVNNDSSLASIQALPGGGFLAVVTVPTGTLDRTTGLFPGFDEFLQRITVSGSTVTFDTPVLVEQTTTAGVSGDTNLDPVVLSNGNILLNINGTYEILNASELPTSNTGEASTSVASMTLAFNSGSPTPAGTTIVDPISDNNGGVFAALQKATNGGFYYGKLDSSVYAADFNAAQLPAIARARCIRTKRGEKRVEKLKVGDQVMTASGAPRLIKWIGRRSYAGRFVEGRKDILPVCIKAGALADNVPKRDLWISPHHAMFFKDENSDGVLIEAKDLVNGASIVQAERVKKVEYFHIELDSHDVIVAEGALSETYLDEDNRLLFHNASEYAELYPDAVAAPAAYYAPRSEEGYEVEAVRHRIALRAGLIAGNAASAGKLRGCVERVSQNGIAGWAQDVDHPDAPVCLDIYADGRPIGQVLANRYRSDLKQRRLRQRRPRLCVHAAGRARRRSRYGRGLPRAGRRETRPPPAAEHRRASTGRARFLSGA